jgi:hypothetical protein
MHADCVVIDFHQTQPVQHVERVQQRLTRGGGAGIVEQHLEQHPWDHVRSEMGGHRKHLTGQRCLPFGSLDRDLPRRPNRLRV